MVLAQRMEDRPELREMIAGLFDLIMVDEFQDTNFATVRDAPLPNKPTVFDHEQRHHCWGP